MREIIEGLKLIRQTGVVDEEEDDPSYPYRVHVVLRPPEFMVMCFVGLYGPTEEVVVLAKTKEALDRFIEINDFTNHPRFEGLRIWGPGFFITEGSPRYWTDETSPESPSESEA